MRALAFGCVAIFRVVYGAKKESHQPEADDLSKLKSHYNAIIAMRQASEPPTREARLEAIALALDWR